MRRPRPKLETKADVSEGPAVDRQGTPVVDPTANVIALVQGNRKAFEDLRNADVRYYDACIRHAREMSQMRAQHAEVLRISDLDRLDKTRQVDVLAASASAAALATAVQTLATTSDRNAETLRNLVTATAQTMAKQTADQAQVLSAQTDLLVKDINARIADLQKSQYQGVGKSSVTDPVMDALISEVRKLSGSREQGEGKAAGINWVGALAVGAIVILSGLAAIGAFLYAILK